VQNLQKGLDCGLVLENLRANLQSIGENQLPAELFCKWKSQGRSPHTRGPREQQSIHGSCGHSPYPFGVSSSKS
jgi:hypothetical protein